MSSTYMLRTPDATTYGPIDEATLVAWARERRVPMESVLVAHDGTEVPIRQVPSVVAAINDAPPVVPVPRAPAPMDDTGISTMIPYKNSPALIGYYLSVASILTVILGPFGLALSIPAVVLGIKGLQVRKARPEASGLAHAIVAISLGGVMALLAVGVLVVIIVAIATQ